MVLECKVSKEILNVCQSHISCISGVEDFLETTTMWKWQWTNIPDWTLWNGRCVHRTHTCNLYKRLKTIPLPKSYAALEMLKCLSLVLILSLNKSEKNIIVMFSITINLRALILFIALCTIWRTKYGRPTVVVSPKNLKNIYHCFFMASPLSM